MGARFSAPVQSGPGAHPASCTMGTGSFPGVKSGRGVTLTPHPLLVLWSWMGRAIPLLLLWAVRPVQNLSACTRVTFTFFIFYISLHIKHSLFLLELNGTWICFCRQIFKYHEQLELGFSMRTDTHIHTETDGRTDRHYEANSRFFAVLRTHLKKWNPSDKLAPHAEFPPSSCDFNL